MKKYFALSLTLICFWSFSAYSAPTIEGLFRNGNNPDLNGDLVAVGFSVEELPTEVSKELMPTRYSKLFMTHSSSRIDLLHVDFANSQFTDAGVLRTAYVSQVSDDIRESKIIEKSLFEAVMASLLLNDARPMSAFLKLYGTGYKTNKESMNPEKIELLQKYKDYLIATSEEGGSVKEAIKASKQGSAEERTKALEVINTGVYDKTDRVKLTRESGKFYWAVDLGSVKALFSNEEHRLKKIQVNLEGGKSIELECGDYVTLDGTHELPRAISLRDSSNSLFRISFGSLQNVSDKSGNVARMAKYEKLAKSSKTKATTSKFLHSFLH